MTAPILLIGKNGQIGAELVHLLPSLGELIALDRAHLDLARPDQIRKTIRDTHPLLIINAAAYTSVDKAESDENAAYTINAAAPAAIAEEAATIGALLVHYSTDYVFDGAKCSPYGENDPTNPLNVYGKTKLAGELAIRKSGAAHLIFRTEWVYSTRGHNFLLTMIRLMSQREELRIVSDQIGAPTSARQVALGTLAVLKRCFRDGGFHAPPDATGTYHMTAGGETSWHGFAQAIHQCLRSTPRRGTRLSSVSEGRPLTDCRIAPISTAEYPTPARRPPYSVLSNGRLHRNFAVQLPHWQSQLDEVLAELEK